MSRNERIAAAVTVAVVLLIALVVTVRGHRADDVRSDGYYCTLAGVGPFDRGPETGRMCADLLND